MKRIIKAVTLSAIMILSASGFAGASEFRAAPLRAEIKTPEPVMIRKAGKTEKPVNYGYRRSQINWDYFDSISDNSTDSVLRKGAALPVSYDNRENMPPVTNQNPFGNCWTHAATAAASANLVRKNILKPEDSLLAEWQLTYFAYHKESEDLIPFFYKSISKNGHKKPYYDAGGTDWLAVALMSRGTGMILRKDFTYPKTTAEADAFKLEHRERAFRIVSAPHLGIRNLREIPVAANGRIETVKKAIYENGAVSVGIAWPSESVINQETHAFYTGKNQSDTVPDHAVTLVGWDDNYSKENFNQTDPEYKPENDGAWILRNSWGTDKGEKGYYYISYEEKTLCDGIAFEMEKAPEKETIYQYDPLGCANFIYKEGLSDGISGANIFKAHSNAENIDHVALYTAVNNQKVEIKIYTGCKVDNPVSGKLAHTQEETITLPGFHTINLSQHVKLTPGENFSVAVKYFAQDGKAYIPVESTITPDSPTEDEDDGDDKDGEEYEDEEVDECAYASSEKNESWIAADSAPFADLFGQEIRGNREWSDGQTGNLTMKNINLCIKAIDDGVKAPEPQPEPAPESGSSGCSAGFAGLALLILIPALAKRSGKNR